MTTERAIVILLLYASFLGNTIWCMMSGWGLEPQSWGVIIGSNLLGLGIAVIIRVLSNENYK